MAKDIVNSNVSATVRGILGTFKAMATQATYIYVMLNGL